MPEYKVLTDNSALRRKLEGKNVADGADLVSLLTSEREPDLGEQRMMADFGLTESELFSGLAGQSVDEWVFSNANESGVDDPQSSPAVLRHLTLVKQLNADAHGIGFPDYEEVGTAIVRSRLKVLWGSGMTGPEYLRRNLDVGKMDWSGIDLSRFRTRRDVTSTRKALTPNAPSDDIFSLSGDSGSGFEGFKAAKRRERLAMLEGIPNPADALDGLFDDE